MAAPYTTERGEKLDVFRDLVETTALLFNTTWRKGPMNHTLYAAIARGIIRGDIPTPVE